MTSFRLPLAYSAAAMLALSLLHMARHRMSTELFRVLADAALLSPLTALYVPFAVNFDRVAPYYRWLERLVFGRALEECRTALLPLVSRCERALCIGDGDGRFTHLLLQARPEMQVDVVERSRSMIRLARRRSNARFFHANALAFTPDDRYDLIVTQFVLDTFTSAEVSALVRRVRKAAPGGIMDRIRVSAGRPRLAISDLADVPLLSNRCRLACALHSGLPSRILQIAA